MSVSSWVAFALGATLLTGYTVWTYRSREFPVRGRGMLATLRSLALALILLLLFNPAIPGEPRFGGARRWLLVDASASMSAPASSAVGTPWDSALAVVAGRASGALVATFGEAVEVRDEEAPLAALGSPSGGHSLLVPALERAAEAGAREVSVVSDLRIEDPVAVEAALARLGLAVRWMDVGGEVRNAGVAAVEQADPARGEPRLDVAIFASGTGADDSLLVRMLEEGRPVASRSIAAPSRGRRAVVSFDLPPEAAVEGTVRYEALVALEGDAHPADDAGAAYVDVTADEGRLVLVSLESDWEPRFLLPALAGVTGLEARGFLRVGDGRFLSMGGGGEGLMPAASVAREAASAELLVLHGVGADAPAWAREAAAASRRLLLMPAAPSATRLAGVEAAVARPGEWYVSGELPPSPLARELAGIQVAALPPLTSLFPVAALGPTEVVLRVQLRGTGPAQAAVVVSSEEGRRVATALASGFWRWAFRPGEPREAYRRLWSGVAGWLLAEPVGGALRAIAPADAVVAAGEPILWSAGGWAGDTVSLRAMRGDSLAFDTTMAVPQAATFRTPPLPPGTYAWAAERGVDSAGGRLDVAPALDLAHARWSPPTARADGGAAGAASSVGRPARTRPLPYLLLLVLLAAEWTLRRRRGLR